MMTVCPRPATPTTVRAPGWSVALPRHGRCGGSVSMVLNMTTPRRRLISTATVRLTDFSMSIAMVWPIGCFMLIRTGGPPADMWMLTAMAAGISRSLTPMVTAPPMEPPRCDDGLPRCRAQRPERGFVSARLRIALPRSAARAWVCFGSAPHRAAALSGPSRAAQRRPARSPTTSAPPDHLLSRPTPRAAGVG